MPIDGADGDDEGVQEELPHRHPGDAFGDLDVVLEGGVVRQQADVLPNSLFGLNVDRNSQTSG